MSELIGFEAALERFNEAARSFEEMVNSGQAAFPIPGPRPYKGMWLSEFRYNRKHWSVLKINGN